MKLFYDGCNLTTFASYPNVIGFTTNTSIMKQSKQFSYKTFYDEHRELIADRPISFQIFSDEPSVILEQAKQIHSLGKSIYVKIPVMNSKGEYLLDTISQLLKDNIYVNITAVCTKEQINRIVEMLSTCPKTPTIVSVFSGRISDTGTDPREMISYAVQSVSSMSWVEILWAGVRDNLAFDYASKIGCHIITVPDAVLSRAHRIGQPLDGLTTEVVTSFLKDGKELSIF